MSLLLSAHRGWWAVVVLVAVVAIGKLLIGWIAKSKWSKIDQGIGATLPIVMDIQLLMGLVLYFMAPQAWFVSRSISVWEHLGTMFLAVIVAHVSWVRVKRSDIDAIKFRNGTIGYLVAGLLVIIGVVRMFTTYL